MRSYVHLRWLMLKRMAAELGILMSVLLTIIALALAYAFTYLAWYWQAATFGLVLLCIHQKRRDIGFLTATMGQKQVRLIVMLDYAAIVMPFCILNLLRGNGFISLVLVGVALVVANMKRCTWQILKPTKTLLRMGGFEYEKGFRESMIVYCIAVILSVIAACYGNINLGKFATITLFMVFVVPSPNIIAKREYMACYRSMKRLDIMATVNALAYIAIFMTPFVVLFTFKWYWQGARFCGLLYIVAVLSALEMSLLRYHINGNVILSVVSIMAMLFLGMATLMMPLLLLVYVIAIMLTYLLTYNKIKEKIYGCY